MVGPLIETSYHRGKVQLNPTCRRPRVLVVEDKERQSADSVDSVFGFEIGTLEEKRDSGAPSPPRYVCPTGLVSCPPSPFLSVSQIHHHRVRVVWHSGTG